MRLIAWIKKRGWLPPETIGPIAAGQVWAMVRFKLGLMEPRNRCFVRILRLEKGVVWFSLIPGPTFQNVAMMEQKFRKLYRFVPDIVAAAPAITRQHEMD